MKLSGLVIAVILLISVTLFAQRTSGTSGSSSGSSSNSSSSSSSSSHVSSPSSSGSSSGSSSSSASHGSYSGGSAASAGSVSSHSSSSLDSHASPSRSASDGSRPASGHSSPGAVPHIANGGAQPSRSNSDSERAAREPNPEPSRRTLAEAGKLSPSSTKLSSTATKENTAPEKRSFFSFFRHPFKPKPKPVRIAEIKRPVRCLEEPCAVCPPGESRNGKGVCVAVVARNQCEPGQSWNGGACAAIGACQAGTFWNGMACAENGQNCATYDSRAAAMSNELRGIRSEMDRACMQAPNGQQCRELTLQHDGALLRYRGLLNEAPVSCRATMPDPLSL